MWPFFRGPAFFWTTLPHVRGLSVKMGGMPLHDVVGVNCKMAQLLKMKACMSGIWAKGCVG